MRRTKPGALLLSIRRFVAVSLILFGAGGTTLSAWGQTATDSAYSLGTTSVTIGFNTRQDWWSGATKLNFATASAVPDKIDIHCNTETGLIPPKINVEFELTYNGKPERYAGLKKWQRIKKAAAGDHYEVPLDEFAKRFIEDISRTLPLNFDPNAAPAFGTSATVTVTVTPMDECCNKGHSKTVDGTVEVTLLHVVSDIGIWAAAAKKKDGAGAAAPKQKPARKPPKPQQVTSPRKHAQAPAPIPCRCPHCWSEDTIVHPAPVIWVCVSATAIAPACPAPAYLPGGGTGYYSCSQPFYSGSGFIRTCGH